MKERNMKVLLAVVKNLIPAFTGFSKDLERLIEEKQRADRELGENLLGFTAESETQENHQQPS